MDNLRVKKKEELKAEDSVKKNLSLDVKQLLKNAISFSKSSTKVGDEFLTA